MLKKKSSAPSAFAAQFTERITPDGEFFDGSTNINKVVVIADSGPTLEQTILSHLLLLESVTMRIANRVTEAYGLTFTQWTALSVISHEGRTGITHSDLSRRLMLSKSPVMTVVDRLERYKIIHRVPDVSDRRVSRVVIERKGL